MSFDENKPLPVVGDRVRQNYGDGHIATWPTWGIVLAVLDGGNRIVLKRWGGKRWGYEAVHRVTWCVMPFEIKAKRRRLKMGKSLDPARKLAVG